MNDFATIKVRRELRLWLKKRAADADLPMYQLLEDLVAEALGGQRLWDDSSPQASATRARGSKAVG